MKSKSPPKINEPFILVHKVDVLFCNINNEVFLIYLEYSVFLRLLDGFKRKTAHRFAVKLASFKRSTRALHGKLIACEEPRY